MNIREIHNPWRDGLLPAAYKGCEFHVEASTVDSGRRLVVHEFPKREKPYAEDMGRRAIGAGVRAYCISFMSDTRFPLYRRDYRIARDLLRNALDAGGPGRLQLPGIPAIIVACDRYRLVEEQRLGGYCTFDIQFVEQGVEPGPPPPDARITLIQRSEAMYQQILANLRPAA